MNELLSRIPHRPPFLFVDRVETLEADRIVAWKRFDAGMDFYRGHYPGRPVTPGVLLCECCFQAGAILLGARCGWEDLGGGVPLLTRIRDARFRRLVPPDREVRIEVNLEDELDQAFHLSGRLTESNRPVLQVRFACLLWQGEGAPP